MALRSAGKLLLWRVFPFLRRRTVRRLAQSKPKGIRKVDYWGLKGSAPELPAQLSEVQRQVLKAFAGKAELWMFRTNLWDLFGLPGTAAGLRNLLAER
jgi:hypothetical protein